jgi:hypothetical protein
VKCKPRSDGHEDPAPRARPRRAARGCDTGGCVRRVCGAPTTQLRGILYAACCSHHASTANSESLAPLAQLLVHPHSLATLPPPPPLLPYSLACSLALPPPRLTQQSPAGPGGWDGTGAGAVRGGGGVMPSSWLALITIKPLEFIAETRQERKEPICTI